MVKHTSEIKVDLNDKEVNLFFNQFVSLPKFNEKSTCACVGSSPILLEHEHGKLIDSYDIVIRMNDSRIKGYEKHTGKKTDIRVMNGSTFAGTCNKERFPIGSDENWVFGEETKGQTFVVKNWSNDEFIIGHFKTENRNPANFFNPAFTNYCNSLTRDPKDSSFHEATTGFIGIMFAMMFFKKIDLFGFSFYNEKDFKKFHFYEEVEEYKPGHKFDIERNMVDQFEKEGRLKIYR